MKCKKNQVPLHWKEIFLKCKQTSIDSQLEWFQLRLLHRIIPTNKYVLLCKIRDFALCTFCSHEDNSISHLFWSCRVAQKFWTDLAVLRTDQYVHCDSLTFNKTCILSGVANMFKTDRVLDLILLHPKLHTVTCKLLGSTPSITVFQRVLK